MGRLAEKGRTRNHVCGCREKGGTRGTAKKEGSTLRFTFLTWHEYTSKETAAGSGAVSCCHHCTNRGIATLSATRQSNLPNSLFQQLPLVSESLICNQLVICSFHFSPSLYLALFPRRNEGTAVTPRQQPRHSLGACHVDTVGGELSWNRGPDDERSRPPNSPVVVLTAENPPRRPAAHGPLHKLLRCFPARLVPELGRCSTCRLRSLGPPWFEGLRNYQALVP